MSYHNHIYKSNYTSKYITKQKIIAGVQFITKSGNALGKQFKIVLKMFCNIL